MKSFTTLAFTTLLILAVFVKASIDEDSSEPSYKPSSEPASEPSDGSTSEPSDGSSIEPSISEYL